jgi:acetyl-CoA acyltransferase
VARGNVAVIVAAVRSPYGRRGGALAGWHPVDLSAEVLAAALGQAGLDPGRVEAVVWGCASQVGAQAGNIGRRAALAAGLDHAFATTIDAHASSSAQAVHWAVQAVLSGVTDVVVAGGVEVMTAVPLGAPLAQPGLGKPLGQRLTARYRDGGGLLPPGLVAEELARRCSLSRADLDAWAMRSYRKARAARGVLAPYMLAVRRPGEARSGRGGLLQTDEGLAVMPTRAAFAELVPAYRADGVVTAANMAGEGDGASAVVVASAPAAEALGLSPRARFVSLAAGACGPEAWPMAASVATARALARAGLVPADVPRWHVLETSAAAVLAWAAECGVPLDMVNPHGGALASTAPLGAVGSGLFAGALASLSGGAHLVAVCTAGEGGVGTTCLLAPPG